MISKEYVREMGSVLHVNISTFEDYRGPVACGANLLLCQVAQVNHSSVLFEPAVFVPQGLFFFRMSSLAEDT